MLGLPVRMSMGTVGCISCDMQFSVISSTVRTTHILCIRLIRLILACAPLGIIVLSGRIRRE